MFSKPKAEEVHLAAVKPGAEFTHEGKRYMRSASPVVSIRRQILCYPVVVRVVWRSQSEWLSPLTVVTVEQSS